MNKENAIILGILAEDREVISYRKNLNNITGSVTATILLQQIIYWSKIQGWKPFFKFRAPCKHKRYKPGDSWTDELGFSGAEFDTAISKIGTKITKGTNKAEAYKKTDATGLVIYWTDASRVTWYHLNVELLGNLIKSNYLVSQESGITKKSGNDELPVSETTTETTTKTTQDIGKNYLEDAVNHQTGKEAVAQPTDFDKHFGGYRDDILQIYHQTFGIKLNEGRKASLIDLGLTPDFDIDVFKKYTEQYNLRGGNPYNVGGFITGYGIYKKSGSITDALRGAYSEPETDNGEPEEFIVDPETGEQIPW